LPPALALAVNAEASVSPAGSSETPLQKGGTANPANTAANDMAANAAAVAADLVATGQPIVPQASADKANANGKTARSTSSDGTGRTSSKQNGSTAKADAPPASTVLDPSLQGVVLASAGLDGGASALQPSQPSLLVQSGAGQGDPNLKAIMTASAVATANSAAKMGANANDAGDEVGPTIVSVLSTETHFAPPAQLSPVQQIADTVIGALPNPSHPFDTSAATDAGDAGATPAATAAAGTGAPDSGASAITGPVKILNLQLEPPSLGTVTINLSLSDGGLNVQVAASQSSTMSLIDKDKDALSNQLRESGYSVAGVGVTLGLDGSNVANNGSATQDQMGQSAAQGGQTMSNGGSSNGNGSSQSGGNGSPQQPLPQTADHLSPSAARSPAAGDLYI
jgi:flagellar hook-length control protein FliK